MDYTGDLYFPFILPKTTLTGSAEGEMYIY